MSSESANPVDEMNGADFSFPYDTPYEIQLNLMRKIYACISSRKVGIFESPTGTGKSLSILCATLTWLRHFDESTKRELAGKLHELQIKMSALDADPDWVKAQTKKMALSAEAATIKAKSTALNEVESTITRIRLGEKGRMARMRQTGKRTADDDADFLDSFKDDVKEDDEFAPSDDRRSIADDDTEEKTPPPVQKIYYVSRTHSQLAQFLRELQRCRQFSREIRVSTIGSRASLCVNDAVKALGNASLINDRCMSMQSGKASTSKAAKVDVEECHTKPCDDSSNKPRRQRKATSACGPCQFHTNEPEVDLGENMLSRVRDVDGVLRLAKSFNACPYYATRHTALPLAQLVLAPYQILLHSSARDAWNIDLTDAVVIVDEAHNLFDAIANMHQASMSLTQLSACQRHLRLYMTRYASRLSGVNLMNVRQLSIVVDRLVKHLGEANEKKASRVEKLPQFLKETLLDDVNIFKIFDYLDRSQMCRKIFGFASRYGNDDIKTDVKPPPRLSGVARLLAKSKDTPTVPQPTVPPPKLPPIHPSSIYAVKSFIEALCSRDDDGRVMTCVDQTSASYKFLLLNAGSRFEPVVTLARSVILIGGTMSPSTLLEESLKRDCHVKEERFMRFTCGHVIESDRLLPLVLSRAPSGERFTVTYETRYSEATLKALGTTLEMIGRTSPGGVVVFFGSYDYMHTVVKRWTQSGMLKRIEAITSIYTEPRSTDEVTVESVLRDYGASITKRGRAMLLAVVGGKMSEGINFENDLGRCVVIVGLPYANKTAVDLKEKMSYLTEHTGRLSAGSEYYEATCMSAVNQCIGRVIRHRGDYASIVLFDARYGSQKIREKLAGWIRKWVTVLDTEDAHQTMKTKMDQFYEKLKSV